MPAGIFTAQSDCYHRPAMSLERNTAIVPPQRQSLGSLIDLYESNYYRLLRLVPELRCIEGTVVSRVAGALDLYLTVHEQQRYTTTLSLTYWFGDELQSNAGIVVYHDVHAAELVSFSRRRRRRSSVRTWRRRPMPDLERKWHTNRFLQKWLGFCHRQGHLFLLVTCPRIPQSLPLEPIRYHG